MNGLHLDRLSASDAAFLDYEDHSTTHMQVGWVMIVEGPPPDYDAVLAHVRSRLPMVPRYRQKLLYPPLGVGRPFWIDDPRFNLEYHVRHSALPSPGSPEQLEALAGRLFSQRLDRSKPLWEMWLVQGLADHRFAIITKAHRALVDGVRTPDITTVLFDAVAGGSGLPAVRQKRWIPHPEPSPAQLLVAGLRDLAATPRAFVDEARRWLASPDQAVDSALRLVAEFREQATIVNQPPPPTPLNVPVGPHRRIVWARYPLEDFREIRSALGATVNDVYLAAVTGALSRWLQRHRADVSHPLRAAVPVSTRIGGDPDGAEGRVTGVFAPLPVGCTSARERLQIVRRALAGLKSSRQALGARDIASQQAFSPPALMAQVARLGFSARHFNLIVANVPGPANPVYLLGREVTQLGPIGFLIDGSALMFLQVSYNGHLEIALTGDPDAIPDFEELRSDLDLAVDELRAAAREATRVPEENPSRSPAPRRATRAKIRKEPPAAKVPALVRPAASGKGKPGKPTTEKKAAPAGRKTSPSASAKKAPASPGRRAK